MPCNWHRNISDGHGKNFYAVTTDGQPHLNSDFRVLLTARKLGGQATLVRASPALPAPAAAVGAWQSPAHGQHSPAPGRTALARAAVHIPQWRSLLVNWRRKPAARPLALGSCLPWLTDSVRSLPAPAAAAGAGQSRAQPRRLTRPSSASLCLLTHPAG
jgi:hypothetical protein